MPKKFIYGYRMVLCGYMTEWQEQGYVQASKLSSESMFKIHGPVFSKESFITTSHILYYPVHGHLKNKTNIAWLQPENKWLW